MTNSRRVLPFSRCWFEAESMSSEERWSGGEEEGGKHHDVDATWGGPQEATCNLSAVLPTQSLGRRTCW